MSLRRTTPRRASGRARAETEDVQRSRTFNQLTAREWTALSRNVWNDVSSPRAAHHLKHGAVYPVKLAERVIRVYSAPGDLVLDPFVGIGSTLVAARNLGRSGIGIELNPEFAQVAERWMGTHQDTLFEAARSELQVYTGDCREVLPRLPSNHFQLIMTSPPYANFIQRSLEDRARTHKTSRIRYENKSVVRRYSDDPRDFGNLNYQEFLGQLGDTVLPQCFRTLRPGGYAVWVVKDYRDTRTGRAYIDFHSDLARAAERVGFVYHDLIIWDQNEQRSLVLLGYPTVFYTNQNCSFLVVLRKPL